MRAVIVGPGVMGELMGKAWGEVLPEGELVFLGKEGERARFLAERYGGRAAYAVAETPPGDWVFSPGGTTAEAMYRLEEAGFRPALSRAVWAAYQRALLLSPDTAEGDR